MKEENQNIILEFINKKIIYVDEDGNVYKNNYKGREGEVEKLTVFNHQQGYGYINLYCNKKHMHFLHHHVVWLFFNGRIEEGLQINHKDLDKKNNKIENLEVVTDRENKRHAFKNKSNRRNQ